ncbi:hypothetical protein RHMOL_Rhmol10G0125600 [Rhododendron molle]|uniref:Uncharacterized protein n=1 Tax=Rhododendron molle TaxID=49168 RepID=A0ACC0M387_RHOML|nr:hypothetical protein RHMOL_Rhmol10G0125600 [Rhododendron molle]
MGVKMGVSYIQAQGTYSSLAFFFIESIMAMGEVKDNEAYGEELLFYEEEDEKAPDSVNGKPTGGSAKK